MYFYRHPVRVYACGLSHTRTGKIRIWDRTLTYKTLALDNKDDAQSATAAEAEVLWSSIDLSWASQAEISKLLDTCSVASFGFKGKCVVDKSYRDACKLDPKDFMTSFQLINTQILDQLFQIVLDCKQNCTS